MESAISIPSATFPLTLSSSSPSSILGRRTIPSPSPSISFSSSASSFFSNALSSSRDSRIRGYGAVRVHFRTRSRRMSCNCLFGLGVPELVVIAGVAALVFGPKKLPEVGRSIGKTVKSFQQAAKEFETELKKEPDTVLDTPVETPTAGNADEKEETKAPSTKESA